VPLLAAIEESDANPRAAAKSSLLVL